MPRREFRLSADLTTAAAPAAPTPSRWGPFGHLAFTVIWTASLVSNVGTAMFDTASGWLITGLDANPSRRSLLRSIVSLGTLPRFAHNSLHLKIMLFVSLFDSPGSLIAPLCNLITCWGLFHTLCDQVMYFAIRCPGVETYLGFIDVFSKNNFELPSRIPSSPCAAVFQHVRQHTTENVRHFFLKPKRAG